MSLGLKRSIQAKIVLVGLALTGFLVVTALLYQASIHSIAGTSDDATVILEGQAMAHGHLTLHGWALSVDSFWSVDAVFYALAVLILGVKAKLMQLVPAVIASCIVMVGTAIAWRGQRRRSMVVAAVILVMFLVFPNGNFDVFYLQGPLHVATTLWALLAFYLVRQHWWGWVLAVCFLAAGMMGDLQMLAFGLVPMFVAGVFAIVRKRSFAAGALELAAGVAALVLELVVRGIADLVGTFGIGKVQPSATRAQRSENLSHLAADLFKVFGTGGDFAGVPPKYIQDFHALGLGICALGVIGAIVMLAKGVIKPRNDTFDSWRLDDLLLLGCIGGLIVFVELARTNGAGFYRYLTSAVIFAVILAARVIGRSLDRNWSLRTMLISFLAAVILLGFSFDSYVISLGRKIPQQTATTLGKFLESHDFKEGIGDYWSSSITTVVTDGNVLVRPVGGDPTGKVVRYQRQSTNGWYGGVNFQFLVYNTVIPSSIDLTVATNTFGPPSHDYSVGEYQVLTWPHSISVAVKGYDPG